MDAPAHRLRLLALSLAVGAAVRLVLLAPAWSRPLDDPDQYLALARSVADGHGLTLNGRPTAYRPPLYPLLLAPGIWLEGDQPRAWALGWNLALGLACVAACHLAAVRWGLSSPGIAAAGLIAAADPVLAAQGRSVMTETLSAALVAATLAALASGRSLRSLALAGLLAGLAALSRPSLLPACLLISAAIAAHRPSRASLTRASVFLATVAAVLSPWAVRNALLFGEPVWTTTHGGYTFALANNDVYYDEVLHGPPGAVWSGPNQYAWFVSVNRIGRAETEPKSDRLYYAEGWRVARHRPRDFLFATAARLGRFWGLSPSGEVYGRTIRALTMAWTLPFWLLVAASFPDRSTWSWPRIAALAYIGSLTFVHALYWTDLRMRAPIVPALALLAGSAVSRAWSFRQGVTDSSRSSGPGV